MLREFTRWFPKKKIQELKNFNSIQNKECKKCEIAAYCVESSCIMQNIAVTGDKNKPAPIFCRLRKLMFEIYQEHKAIIKCIKM